MKNIFVGSYILGFGCSRKLFVAKWEFLLLEILQKLPFHTWTKFTSRPVKNVYCNSEKQQKDCRRETNYRAAHVKMKVHDDGKRMEEWVVLVTEKHQREIIHLE